MNRNDLKKLASIRLKEAKILLDNHMYDGAYYLCGYVVECGLKACIAKKTKKYDFPDFKTVENSYKHNLATLVGIAGLNQQLQQEIKKNPVFAVKWTIVKDWDVESRYQTNHNALQSSDLYSAISDKKEGVLKWIKLYW
jgi:hypothetical protein